MQTPSWRLFLMALLGAGISLGAGYFACIRGAGLLLQMAVTFGVFGLLGGATMFWFARKARIEGAPPIVVTDGALRSGAACGCLMLVTVALAFTAYTLSGNRAIEISSAVLLAIGGSLVLIRYGLWPDQIKRSDSRTLSRTFGLQLAIIGIFTLNFALMLANVTERPASPPAYDLNVAFYSGLLPFFVVNLVRTWLSIKAERRRRLPV